MPVILDTIEQRIVETSGVKVTSHYVDHDAHNVIISSVSIDTNGVRTREPPIEIPELGYQLILTAATNLLAAELIEFMTAKGVKAEDITQFQTMVAARGILDIHKAQKLAMYNAFLAEIGKAGVIE